jgi:hypothetical protein
VRRPKVVPGGCDFHVFHDWPLMHVIPDSQAYQFMT